MALYVNTNVSSLNAQRKLTNATNNLNVSYQRLASGLRINSAKDDAGGLLISNRLTSQINGLDQGNRNASDGIALIQTIEGALEETNTMLQRIRTLAIQAANGTYTETDRLAIQQEVTQLSKEITRISEKTTFAGARILDGAEAPNNSNRLPMPNTVNPTNLLGTSGNVSFQVGANHDDTMGIDLSTGFSMSAIAGACGWPGDWMLDPRLVLPPPPDPTIPEDDHFIFPSFDYFDIPYSSLGGAFGSSYFGFYGLPKEYTESQTGLVQEVTEPGVWIGTTLTRMGQFIVEPKTFVRWSVTSQVTAQRTLENIDKFIQFVDSTRADLGALQNRMESTIRNQSNIAENEADARSRIRDTDFAMETASLTQNNIIQQASQSILAQANQRPQVALSLLGN